MKPIMSLCVLLALIPSVGWAQVLETLPNQIPLSPASNSPIVSGVDVEGDVMAVGMPREPNAGNNFGAVYVLGRNVGGTNAWGLSARVELPPQASGSFGDSVALDADTLVVAGSVSVSLTSDRQVVLYVFSRNQGGPNNWGFIKSITLALVPNPVLVDFVANLVLDSDTLAVGLPYADGPSPDFRRSMGKVYIYGRNQGGANNWGAITDFYSPYDSRDDYFGFDIDLKGDQLVAGAPGAFSDGRVYLFDRNNGGSNNWGLTSDWGSPTITRCGPENCLIGTSVSFDGGLIAVTTPVSTADSGSVDVIDIASNSAERVLPSDGEATDLFGRDLKLVGSTLYVGASKDDDNAQDSGSVYVFERNAAGGWDEVKKLQAPSPLSDDRFGLKMDVDGSTVVVARDSDILTSGPIANFAPEALSQDLTTQEDTPLSVTLTGMDTDPLTFTVVDMPGLGALSGTAPDLTYTPLADVSGEDTFTFVVSDGVNTSAPATVTIEITPVNDAPVANSIARATLEGVPLMLTLSAQDVESDPLSFRVVTQPSSGTLSGDAPTLTYTPDPGFSGVDTFTFVANDGQVDSAEVTATLTVNEDRPDNRPPVASDLEVVVETSSPKMFTLMGVDPDGDGVTFEVVAAPANGTLTGDAPMLTYTPNADFYGVDTFTFVVSDGALTSAPATVRLRVLEFVGQNVEPVFTAPSEGDVLSAVVGQQSVFTLTATDADDDPLSFSAVGLPEGASLDATSGELRWTPQAQGSFGVVLSVSDGQSMDTRSVTLEASLEDSGGGTGSGGGSSTGEDEGCSGCASGRTGAPDPLLLMSLLAGGFMWLRRRSANAK